MTSCKRILITPGEPAGVGPDVTIQIAQQAWPLELVVVADPELLLTRAQQLNLPLQLTEFNSAASLASGSGNITIMPVAMRAKAKPGELNVMNAPYVLETLTLASEFCLQHPNTALVTGPVHKEIMNQAGLAFTGHTELLAQQAKVQQTIMLFVVDKLKVALVTTHLPLADVPKAITATKLQQIIPLLHAELQRQFHIAQPKIMICGLNPHAGEGGYLGREEIDIMIPALEELRKQGYDLHGPLPADTIFTTKYLQQADVILAMYHDQALPVVKTLGFDRAVNVTLGLPFVRTSVDHGTALDIAGTANVNPGSMLAALKLAIKLN